MSRTTAVVDLDNNRWTVWVPVYACSVHGQTTLHAALEALADITASPSNAKVIPDNTELRLVYALPALVEAPSPAPDTWTVRPKKTKKVLAQLPTIGRTVILHGLAESLPATILRGSEVNPFAPVDLELHARRTPSCGYFPERVKHRRNAPSGDIFWDWPTHIPSVEVEVEE